VNVPSRLLCKRRLGSGRYRCAGSNRAAVHREAMSVRVDAVREIVPDEQIGPTIAIEVEEDGGHAPAVIVGPVWCETSVNVPSQLFGRADSVRAS